MKRNFHGSREGWVRDMERNRPRRSFALETCRDRYGSRKYRHGADQEKEPRPGTRKKCWVAPHTRNGHRVNGHWRTI